MPEIHVNKVNVPFRSGMSYVPHSMAEVLWQNRNSGFIHWVRERVDVIRMTSICSQLAMTIIVE
jgi:hypothetical protein